MIDRISDTFNTVRKKLKWMARGVEFNAATSGDDKTASRWRDIAEIFTRESDATNAAINAGKGFALDLLKSKGSTKKALEYIANYEIRAPDEHHTLWIDTVTSELKKLPEQFEEEQVITPDINIDMEKLSNHMNMKNNPYYEDLLAEAIKNNQKDTPDYSL